jgi:hypothetical protein
MNQKQKVMNYLNNGPLTPAQATARGIGNVREVVRQLRQEGAPIYLNKRANGKSFYRLGNPTKTMIASAYSVGGATAFN